MTVNELIEVLKETGDEKLRDMTTVEIEGTTILDDFEDENGEPIEISVCSGVSDVKYGFNKVILYIT